jgi:hypothetical protein
MKDDSPPPLPKSVQLAPPTAPTDPKIADAPRPIPLNDAKPVPVPLPSSDPKTVAPPRDKDEPFVLPGLPLPGSQPALSSKRPPSVLPLDKPVGVAPTPPNPTPLDTPITTEDKPAPLPATSIGSLPVPPLPTFELKRSSRNAKPDASSSEPPKPTKVTSPTPIVLPPLPADPLDATTAASK